MTIDEAIVSLRKSASKSLDYEWQREQYQIAKWLEELKDYQDKNKMVVRVDVENVDSIENKIDELSKYAESQYNKAIDDFVQLVHECDWKINNRKENSFIYGAIDWLAEQLKAGVEE